MKRRNTIQRDLVLQTVRNLRTHSTADEVYAALSKEYPSIGRGTVYRNLSILAEEGEILKVEVPGQADKYDFTTAAHYHVKCVECGKIFDVDMDPVEDLKNKIKNTHGIEFLNYEIMFSGVCPDCQKNIKNN